MDTNNIELSKNIKFHLLFQIAIPASPEYVWDAHITVFFKMCKMLYSKGHTVYVYADSKAEQYVQCTKFISIIETSKYDILKDLTNNFQDPNYMTSDTTLDLKVKEERNIIYRNILNNFDQSLLIYYTKYDIILHTADFFKKEYFSNKNMIHVDYSSMGNLQFNQYVSFITFEWKRFHILNKNLYNYQDVILDTNILPWFNPDEYVQSKNSKRRKRTYDKKTFLYLARILPCKGVDNFLEISKNFPQYDFLLAGGCKKYDKERNIINMDIFSIDLNEYPNVKYLGMLNYNTRGNVLSQCTALIQPTTFYTEPCGFNVIESLFYGTPVITSDKGGFIDTVANGVVGYRCCCMECYINSINNIDLIDRSQCRPYAINKFNESQAYKQYIEFFNQIINNLKE